jgi:nitroimidazol reductase NimA-like FMN-containing flavoprotein (pyridoxamine 5'-phosphate oxidase superfamily)
VIDELSAVEIDDFLRRQLVGRVGCHLDGRTYVVPVIYVWDGECVYVQSVEGRKIEMMRRNPSVCFEVDEHSVGHGWRSVIVEGTYEELEGSAAATALTLLVRRFAGLRTRRSEAPSTRAPVAFRIRPERLSGRRVGRLAGNGAVARLGTAALRRRMDD